MRLVTLLKRSWIVIFLLVGVSMVSGESDTPIFLLINPENNSIENSTSVTFEWNITDEGGVANTSIFIFNYTAEEAGDYKDDLDNGLLGYWQLEGNYKDYLENYNCSSLGGTKTINAQVDLGINHSNRETNCSDITLMTAGNSDIVAVSTWLKSDITDYTNNQNAIFDKRDEFFFGITNEDDYTIGTYGGNMDASNCGSIDTNWHHMVWIYDEGNDEGRIYQDGSLLCSGALVDDSGNSAYHFVMGRFENNDYPFYGILDEVMLYNRNLTTSDVSALYDLGSKKLHSDKVLVESSTNTTDLDTNTSSYNYSSTLINGTQYRWQVNAFDDDNITYNISNSYYFNLSAISIDLEITSPANITVRRNESVLVQFTANKAVTWKINDTGNFSINSTGHLINNTILSDKLYHILVTANETATGNTTSVVYEVDSIAIIPVSLISPTDNTEIRSGNITFECHVNNSDNSLQNISLIIDGLINGTNVVGGTSNTTTFDILLDDATYNWNCEGCDTTGDCDQADSNFTITKDIDFPIINKVTQTDSSISDNETVNFTINYTAGFEGRYLYIVSNESGTWKNITTEAVFNDTMTILVSKIANFSIDRIYNSTLPLVPVYNANTNANSTVYFNDLLSLVFFYEYTKEERYLDYAREYANWLNTTDIEKLYQTWDTSSGWNETITMRMTNFDRLSNLYNQPQLSLLALAHLTNIDSSYLSLLESASSKYVNLFINETTNLTYDEVYANGTVISNTSYSMEQFTSSSVFSYVGNITGNSSYTDWALRLIEAYPGTYIDSNIAPSQSVQQSLNVNEDYSKCGATAGIYLTAMIDYYYYTKDSTMLNNIYDEADNISYYCWSADTRNATMYRIEYDTGAENSDTYEFTQSSFDYVLYASYLLSGNQTVLDRLLKDWNESIVDEIMVDDTTGLIHHQVNYQTKVASTTADNPRWSYQVQRMSMILSDYYNDVYFETLFNTHHNTYTDKYDDAFGFVNSRDSDTNSILDSSNLPLVYQWNLFKKKGEISTLDELYDVSGHFWAGYASDQYNERHNSPYHLNLSTGGNYTFTWTPQGEDINKDIGLQFCVIDGQLNTNCSEIKTITVSNSQITDTCSNLITGGVVQCSDFCNYTTTQDASSNDVFFNGTGEIIFTNNLTNTGNVTLHGACWVFFKGGAILT